MIVCRVQMDVFSHCWVSIRVGKTKDQMFARHLIGAWVAMGQLEVRLQQHPTSLNQRQKMSEKVGGGLFARAVSMSLIPNLSLRYILTLAVHQTASRWSRQRN